MASNASLGALREPRSVLLLGTVLIPSSQRTKHPIELDDLPLFGHGRSTALSKATRFVHLENSGVGVRASDLATPRLLFVASLTLDLDLRLLLILQSHKISLCFWDRAEWLTRSHGFETPLELTELVVVQSVDVAVLERWCGWNDALDLEVLCEM